MIKKIRRKFVFFFMLLASLLLLVIFSLILHFTRNSLAASSIQAMQTLPRSNQPAPRPDVPSKEARMSYFALLLFPDGTLDQAYGDGYDLSDQEFLQTLADLVRAKKERTGILSEYHLRYLYFDGPDAARIVFADNQSETDTINSLIQTCILIGLLCLILMLGVSLLLSRWITRPLELAWQQQKQFISDASHELKTPLTVILTNAQLLQNPSCDASSRRTFSSSILTMAEQMRGLVEHLLDLARLEGGTISHSFTRVNFSQISADAVLPFEPLFYEKGLQLDTDFTENLWVNGNADYLTQVVDILLDNALKYANENTTVSTRLIKNGRSCIFSIQNTGETLSPADLSNLFKRFYRVDKSRSMNHSYGLGLSIAQSIINDHKGKIWCTSLEHITTFYITLTLH